jgi:hypothetical protein
MPLSVRVVTNREDFGVRWQERSGDTAFRLLTELPKRRGSRLAGFPPQSKKFGCGSAALCLCVKSVFLRVLCLFVAKNFSCGFVVICQTANASVDNDDEILRVTG